MNIPNRITLNDLRGMQVGAIAALSNEELAPLRLEAEDQLRTAKSLCDWLDGAIALKYGDRAHAARSADEKDTGTIRFADGAVTIFAELPKRVDWDQAKLASLVERIKADREDPTEYVDISFDVAERRVADHGGRGQRPPRLCDGNQPGLHRGGCRTLAVEHRARLDP